MIRSATPALSCRKVSSLTSSKNSWQKCFISINPIRMMAADADSAQEPVHKTCAELTLRIVAILQTINKARRDGHNVLQRSAQ